MPRDLKQGDSYFQTQSTELAAVLSALAFQFWDSENACDIREINGKRVASWVFETEANSTSAGEVAKAWKNADKYCDENPSCRIASAIAAVKNVRYFNEGVKNGKPLVGYKLGERVLWVAKGGDKEIKQIKYGRAKKL